LLAARACLAADMQADAQAALEAGCQWVLQTSQTQVPPQFRDSFLQHNPVNRELLALSTRA
jgi:hypothetical protein